MKGRKKRGDERREVRESYVCPGIRFGGRAGKGGAVHRVVCYRAAVDRVVLSRRAVARWAGIRQASLRAHLTEPSTFETRPAPASADDWQARRLRAASPCSSHSLIPALSAAGVAAAHTPPPIPSAR